MDSKQSFRIVAGRQHDPRCENAKEDDCDCQCRGKFHGLKSGRVARDPKTGKPLFQLQGEKTYFGKIEGDLEWSVFVTNGIETLPLNLRLDLENHSPTGFSWGYYGSGPSQLALALLADATGNDAESVRLHQTFKNEKIATIPKENEWTMTQKEIMEWFNAKCLITQEAIF